MGGVISRVAPGAAELPLAVSLWFEICGPVILVPSIGATCLGVNAMCCVGNFVCALQPRRRCYVSCCVVVASIGQELIWFVYKMS